MNKLSESLLSASIILIGAGTAIISSGNNYEGIAVTLLGVILIFVRGFLKTNK